MIKGNKEQARAQLAKPVREDEDPAKLRVEIAKDVLAGLELELIVPRSSYFVAPKGERVRENDDLRQLIALGKMNGCEVCGIGALFVAHVARFDRFFFSGEPACGILGCPSCGPGVSKADIYVHLNEIFSKQQLADVEDAFEAHDRAWQRAYSKFGKSEDELRRRGFEAMKAICRNIIRNRGTFRIDQDPTL